MEVGAFLTVVRFLLDFKGMHNVDHSYNYDVFISFKNSDKDGNSTKESVLAAQLYEYLINKGLRVFFSTQELEFLGKSQYTEVIDKALETSHFLIAIGCSRENFESEWVRYEWSSFLNDIRSGFKSNAEAYVLYQEMKIADLPRALRQQQSFNVDDGNAFEKINNFIQNAMSRGNLKNSQNAAIPETEDSPFETPAPIETPVLKPSTSPTPASSVWESAGDCVRLMRSTRLEENDVSLKDSGRARDSA